MSTLTHHAIDPKNGTGDWQNFQIPLERIFEAAAEWKNLVAGVEKPGCVGTPVLDGASCSSPS